MTGLGIAVAVLLLGCALLFLPFAWRPAGIFLNTEKVLAVACAAGREGGPVA